MTKIYFNCCLLDHWDILLKSQLDLIVSSGLINHIDLISFHTIGSRDQLNLFRYIIDQYPKVHHEDHNVDLDVYEKPALNQIYIDSQTNNNLNILYIHLKTVARKITFFTHPYINYITYKDYIENIENWRNILCEYSINNWKDCIEYLNSCSACGPMFSITPFKHFSGNFWWAKSSYIKTLLPPMAYSMANAHLIGHIRYCFESWIGSGNGDFVSTFTDPRPLFNGMAPQYFSKLDITLE